MVSIIGAGPAGNYLAYLLAKKKQPVRVFEEHSSIGNPVQCAGLVTSSINDILKLDNSVIVNKIKHAEIIFRDKKIKTNFKKPNLVLDRELFDNFLKDKAESAGANFYLNHKFKTFKKNRISFFGRKSIKTKYLVGADGPFSRVAKVSGLYKHRKFVTGIQARINYKTNPDTIKFYLNYGQFAWIIPESDSIARAGMIGKINPNQEFKLFIKNEISKYKLREYQSGIIPLYNPKQKLNKNNIYLIGDAATQVKATTYGGLIPGLMAARILSENFKTYESKFNKTIGKELKLALLYRQVFNNFDEQDYEELMNRFSKQKTREMIEIYDRDFPTKFLLKLVLSEPGLLKLGARGYLRHIFN